MALLGCLSLVQIVFLPGWIALRILGMPASRMQTAVLSFGLSLVFNHFLVIALVGLHIYRPAALYVVFAGEMVTALLLSSNGLAQPLASLVGALNDECRRISAQFSLKSKEPGRHIRRAIVLVAAGTIVIYAACGLCEAGDIFRQWDAVVSWNRWAIDWAHNDWPRSTSLYPQLLPTNVSLTYVFMQTTEIWCFAKGFQFLFCLMTLVGIFDLAVSKRSLGIAAGVAIAYLLLTGVLRYRMLASGYADMPVAFFTFASVAMLLHASDADDSLVRSKYVLIGCALAVGAALTKQVGLYVAGIYPLLAWQMVYARREEWRFVWPRLVRIAAGIMLFTAPWYCLKKIEVSRGSDHDNTLSLVQGYQQDRTLPQRLVYAAESASQALSPAGLAGVALLIVLSLKERNTCLLVLALVLPWTLIWSLGFSYDLRNLAIVLPLVGVACGVGLERLLASFAISFSPDACVGWSETPTQAFGLNNPRLAVFHALTLIAAFTAFFCLRINDDVLRASQFRRQREVGIPEINARLYEYDRVRGIDGFVATDYLAMPWLPDLSCHRLPCTPRNLESFKSIYDRTDVNFALLCREGTPPDIWNYLQRAGTAAESRLIFETKLYRFYVKTGISGVDAKAIAQARDR